MTPFCRPQIGGSDKNKKNIESAKTDPVRFKWGFGKGLLKDKFAFLRLIKVLYLGGENCLQNAHFYKQKGPCFKTPFKLDRVSFSTPEIILRTFPVVRNFPLKVAANFLEHSFGAFIEEVSPFMPS